MNKKTQPQPTHIVKTVVRDGFSFACDCTSCRLTVRIGSTLEGFRVTLEDDEFMIDSDHTGRVVQVATVSLVIFGSVSRHQVRVDDLEPLNSFTVKMADDPYSHHGEFASQVRYEDERHYEPDPYDADDAWR